MSNLTLHKLYNPHQIPKEFLLKSFVIRVKEFDRIFKDIKNYTTKKSNQHFVIQGQRGSGKSTMLLRLKYEIEKLDNKIPILFDEEEYGITSLEEVWERVWEIIEDEEYLHVDNSIEKNYKNLKQILIEKNKIIVLLIDNIGDILDNFDDENDEYKLREILQLNKHIKIVGGSPYALETYYSYDKPFYDFFNVITLGGLNYESTITYLSKLGEIYDADTIEYIIKNTPARIKTLLTLTGGNPRTIGILFEIFVNDKNGTVFQDLEKLLDSVTALYKHRMEEMSKQHRKIVSAIAQNWESISVKELVIATKMESKAISAQLTKLVKNDIIEVVPTQTKNNLYCIKERFFNIWYLMRYKKKNADKVRWLVEFMDVWYNDDMLKDRVSKHIEKLKCDGYLLPASVKMTEALASLSKKRFGDDKSIRDLFIENIAMLKRQDKYEEYGKELSFKEVDYYFNKVTTQKDKQKTTELIKSMPLNITLELIEGFLVLNSTNVLIKNEKIDLINIAPIIHEIKKDCIGFYMIALLETEYFKFLLKILIEFNSTFKDENISNILFGLIAKKQFNIISEFFENNKETKDKYIALYYTNLKFSGKIDELMKIPKEIQKSEYFNKDLEFLKNFYNNYISEIKEQLNKKMGEPHIKV